MKATHKTLTLTLSLVFFMAGLAWASVPFYDWFCRVTGFGGITSTADAGSNTILEETIKIRFDASVESNMEWSFIPVARAMELKIGETGLAFYEASQGRQATMLLPTRRVDFLQKLIAFVLRNKF